MLKSQRVRIKSENRGILYKVQQRLQVYLQREVIFSLNEKSHRDSETFFAKVSNFSRYSLDMVLSKQLVLRQKTLPKWKTPQAQNNSQLSGLRHCIPERVVHWCPPNIANGLLKGKGKQQGPQLSQKTTNKIKLCSSGAENQPSSKEKLLWSPRAE